MRAPVLAIGDGALGFWAALRGVFPETREQRDCVHKTMNVVDALPTSAQPAARKALAEIRDAEDRTHAEQAVTAFVELFGAKYPKAVAKVVEDTEQLLAFYDFPAEHWVHLKQVSETLPTNACLSRGGQHKSDRVPAPDRGLRAVRCPYVGAGLAQCAPLAGLPADAPAPVGVTGGDRPRPRHPRGDL
jgi:hypothetical protein